MRTKSRRHQPQCTATPGHPVYCPSTVREHGRLILLDMSSAELVAIARVGGKPPSWHGDRIVLQPPAGPNQRHTCPGPRSPRQAVEARLSKKEDAIASGTARWAQSTRKLGSHHCPASSRSKPHQNHSDGCHPLFLLSDTPSFISSWLVERSGASILQAPIAERRTWRYPSNVLWTLLRRE